jgi:transcriptional regulator with XRE-family HTH domain
MAQIVGAQIRMARASLRWSLAELARHAGVGISTVQSLEAVDGAAPIAAGLKQTLDHRTAARDASIEAIRTALQAAGVTFLPDDGNGVGVRVKGKTRRVRAS